MPITTGGELPTTPTALHEPRLAAVPAPPVHPRRTGAVELLWHQREVELTGVLHRIRIPVIGDGSTLVHGLSALLSSWWVDGPSLSPEVNVTSVVADYQESLQGRELVLLVTTDELAYDHSIVNVRMIRDLRRAVRLNRLAAGMPATALAA